MLKLYLAINLAILLLIVNQTWSCNEAVCGAIVSKCLLTQSCKCDRKEDCFCCKDCLNCLGYLFADCCSCVDMCPERNETSNAISKQSYCQELDLPSPSLFEALVSGHDPENRWNSTTFPVDVDVSPYNAKNYVSIIMRTPEQETAPMRKDVFTFNCTVAYWSACMSSNKCKDSCRTMGANSFRWFHDGCCECVGQHCINYGINESRCGSCPLKEEEVEFDEDDEDNYFGEDEED